MIQILYLYLCLLFLVVRYSNVWCGVTVHGRYTRGVESNYELAIPHKLTHHGKFLSFSLPHYFKHESHNRRKRRSIHEVVNYGIVIGGKYYQMRLWPNTKLLSPHAFIEHRDPTIDLEKRKLKMLKGSKVCHYTGKIKGIADSSVALSTCDGLAGYIRMNGKSYFIEPLHEHGANTRGHHMHVIHKRGVGSHSGEGRFCGTSDNWVKDWKHNFGDLKRADAASPSKQSSKAIKSHHRYIEILAVCDKQFMDRHKHIDVQNYVLTIFNMVYDLYHDASIGNMIDVTLVRIIYFEKEEDEIDITITPDAEKTLKRFCEWQQTVNPKDFKSPIHHDIAVLISRYDICDYSMGASGCMLLGLAYVGTPCFVGKECAIVEEGGLSVGYVITHEVGHVMGCSHDNYEISGCNRQAPDNSYFIMSDTASDNVTSWSSCSRDYVTTLLESGFGECLNDEPDESAYHYAEMLPGIVFDGNVQCEWIQQGAKLCPFSNQEICSGIMCNPINTTHCVYMGNKMAMPGTECGDNKWCYKAKCVDKGKRPDAIHGGWGEWGDWGDCSRTCGGGVASKERECNHPAPEHGGRYCVGERKQVKLCNTQPCKEGSKDFRSVQCSEFDNKTVNDKTGIWSSYLMKDEPCVLYCSLNNQYSKLGLRVKDGTKCKLGKKDTCIAGMCRKIGCDNVIDSEAEEDGCGVCGGSGTTCTIVQDIFTKIKRGNGFAVEFPRGAFKVEVIELAPSENTLLLGNKNGTKCINANNQEYTDGVYDCFTMSAIYSHPEENKEVLMIRGPLKEPLRLYVTFYANENVGYHYQYADLTMPHPDYTPQYTWDHIEFSHCTHVCEGGTQVSEASCVEEKMGKMNPEFCKDIEKPPPVTRTCNEKPCKVKWRVGAWGKCKACKGRSGIKLREVECVKESRLEGGDGTILEEGKCKDQKPESRRYCNAKRDCASKRSDSGFPEHMMRELFYQTIVDMLNIDPELKEYFVSQARTIRALRKHLRHYHRRSSLQELCGTMTTTSAPSSIAESANASTKLPEKKVITGPDGKTKIEIGAITLDNKPKDINIIEIHSGGVVPMGNISEEAFQVIGNQLDNTIVFDKKRNYTGKQAQQCLVNLQKVENTTAET